MSSQEDNRQSQFIDEVQLRFLNNNDIGDLKRLCVEWFPLRYVHFYISLFCDAQRENHNTDYTCQQVTAVGHQVGQEY